MGVLGRFLEVTSGQGTRTLGGLHFLTYGGAKKLDKTPRLIGTNGIHKHGQAVKDGYTWHQFFLFFF
jgi:hypothetical protein